MQITITITLSNELKEKIKRRAYIEEIPKAELIRRGIELYLEQPPQISQGLQDLIDQKLE